MIRAVSPLPGRGGPGVSTNCGSAAHLACRGRRGRGKETPGGSGHDPADGDECAVRTGSLPQVRGATDTGYLRKWQAMASKNRPRAAWEPEASAHARPHCSPSPSAQDLQVSPVPRPEPQTDRAHRLPCFALERDPHGDPAGTSGRWGRGGMSGADRLTHGELGRMYAILFL